MPLLGLGTWPMDNDAAASAVKAAVSNGYRLFDTAESYGNEAGVGEGLRRSGIGRDEVFIASKFNKEWHGGGGVARAFEESAKRLGVDYIDLFLIHWPAPAQDRFVEAFTGLEALLRAGKVRSIGTSNVRPGVQALHREKRILTGSYSPLGRGGAFLSHPAVSEAAARHSKTPSQIVLRWHTQQGITTVAKSADPRRQLENLEIFDFELTADEIRRISALDTGGPARLDPDEYAH